MANQNNHAAGLFDPVLSTICPKYGWVSVDSVEQCFVAGLIVVDGCGVLAAAISTPGQRDNDYHRGGSHERGGHCDRDDGDVKRRLCGKVELPALQLMMKVFFVVPVVFLQEPWFPRTDMIDVQDRSTASTTTAIVTTRNSTTQ